MADNNKGGAPAGEPGTGELDAGSYEVVRQRLVGHVEELSARAERLNAARKALFGSSELELQQSTRVRTENAAQPRDMVSVGDMLLFAFNVVLGMKSQPSVADVFSLYKLDRGSEGADAGEGLEPVPLEGTFLADPAFVSDFSNAFRYAKEARVLKLTKTDKRLCVVLQIGERLSDVRVLRFGIDGRGRVTYIDARGEEDVVPPPSFAFAWTRTGREHQVMGAHPHVNVLDEVFVETVGGDLTIKVENNTKDGRGVWREPVTDPNQTLDDAEISYAKLGSLILLKVLPYREGSARHLVYNTLNKSVARIDAIGRACLLLPEDQGILFPGGHYVATAGARVVDPDTAGMRYEGSVRAPNGEDVLYIFYREDEGLYLALPYNVISKDLGAPVRCHGYSLFSDGTMAVFRAAIGSEATRVHPFQLWRTPFMTPDEAERQGQKATAASYLAKVGNPALVRGVSDAFAVRRLALAEEPSRRTFEELATCVARALDDHYWIGHEEAFDLKSALKDVRKSADAILQEFDKVEAYRAEAERALADAKTAQAELLRVHRPEDTPSADSFLGALSALRTQRGRLSVLRELRTIDLAAVAALEGGVDARFAEVRSACVTFFESEKAWSPVLAGLEQLGVSVEKTDRGVGLAPHKERLDTLHSELLLLGETVSALDVDDPTVRTRVLEQLSRALAVQNRVRASFDAKKKELYGREGRAELAVQLGVFAQAVGAAVGACTTPEQCDAELGKLLMRLEELAGRFGELDEFAVEIESKRDEVAETFSSRRQTLSDERHKRASATGAAGERMLQGIARKAATFATEEELLAYFASDPMVHKVAEAADKLAALGENVRADELGTALKVAKQDAVRKLRDKRELSDGEGVRLGGFTFSVTKSAVDLVVVPREGGLALHLTGTDFYDTLNAPELDELREVWDQSLASESSSVYRGEYLAFRVLDDAIEGREGQSLGKLREAAREGRLLAVVSEIAASRLDEGYERGVHDVDAAQILGQLLPSFEAAGPLRFTARARALALMFTAELTTEERTVLTRRAASVARLATVLGDPRGVSALKSELGPRIRTYAEGVGLTPGPSEAEDAADVVVETLGAHIPRFPVARASDEGHKLLRRKLDDAGQTRALADELRILAGRPRERAELALHYAASLGVLAPPLAPFAPEIAAILLTDGALDRDVLSAETTLEIKGLLGTHERIRDGALSLELAELLVRLRHFEVVTAARFRVFRTRRTELLARERERMRLAELVPKVLSSFVRNRLISEVYLPLVGANLAKQIGALGAQKRTDRMGLLFLVSPPGYGKTTLMEYVASVLGLVFVKVNGPALGHDVTSLDPAECQSLTARQEVERVNLGFEMGNNVMLYVDDVQHTSPVFLEKFISLCDAQRKVEGVFRGKSRTYDFRGKRFCVVMAANPYTESGARFRIPDMLANRADTYNLGEVLGGSGMEEIFKLSYLENALTSHPVLAPLSGRDPADLYKLARMAKGEELPASELSHGYSGAELADILAMLRLLSRVQDVLLRVNQTYISAASQEDAYRTEPPFKLQGSYRNMNKIAQKLAPVMTEDELDRAVDEHYAAESQTLTTGAEQNLLKLAELRGRMTPEQRARWVQIKEGFARARRGGKEGDDPVARVVGSVGGVEEQLLALNKAVLAAADRGYAEQAREQRERLEKGSRDASLADALARLGESLGKLAKQDVRVTLENPHPQVVELEAIVQLGQAMASAVARVSGPESGASQAIVAKLAELEAMLQRRSVIDRRPVEVDLRKQDTTNLTCDATGIVRGVFVGTYAKPPALRTEVALQLLFPGNHTAAATGVVAFVQDEDGDRPAGYGVAFTEVGPEGRALIAQYARARQPVLYEV
ncbi:MAG: DNA repair ATPase [Myxococcales bacterium]|nr:DNA repair ATPase [Myxococcales bacterium]